jgi:Protein of unknown function (DUF3048) C-terminal domain/Protein of unknown function (DUF3048) N-terminal domain
MPRGQPSWRARWAGNGLAVVAGLAAAACGSAAPNLVQPGASSPAASPTPTATARADRAGGSTAPLTNLSASAAVAARPAVAVDVGQGAHGLGSADVVFQEFSNPVRYIAVFQSSHASGVGPVTGTQPTDGQVLAVLHPLIAYDGGTPTFIKILDHSKVTDVGDTNDPSAYTTTSQGVFVSTAAASRAAHGTAAPPPLFFYGSGGSGGALATTGLSRPASARVTIPGNGTQTWAFDSHTDRWTLTSGGPRVSVANVVVQTVPYKQAVTSHRYGTTVPSARVVGTGRVEVLSGSAGGGSGGTAAPGTWSKPHPREVTNYFDGHGNPMVFQPGPTWVILAPQGTSVSTSGGS